MSYGQGTCEAALDKESIPNTLTDLSVVNPSTLLKFVPSTMTQFFNALWQQAAAQAMEVFVSSGDSGSGDCSRSTTTEASQVSVSAICSTPYNICIGGTQFNDTAANWANIEDPIDHSSVAYGFVAGPGYDQVTGWGSVDAKQLYDFFSWPY
jgi:subtilase family serine protease